MSAAQKLENAVIHAQFNGFDGLIRPNSCIASLLIHSQL